VLKSSGAEGLLPFTTFLYGVPPMHLSDPGAAPPTDGRVMVCMPFPLPLSEDESSVETQGRIPVRLVESSSDNTTLETTGTDTS
jgi:hypothetical protein